MTEDGLERHFQVNYLSHLLLTLNLLSVMKSSGPDARIVNISSFAHKFGKFDPSNMDGSQGYSRMNFYGNSKLYQVCVYITYVIHCLGIVCLSDYEHVLSPTPPIWVWYNHFFTTSWCC